MELLQRLTGHRLTSIAIAFALISSLVFTPTDDAHAVSTGSHGNNLVSANAPVPWTPHVLDGYVRTIAEVGDIVLAGGNFSTVRQYNNATQLSRDNIVAFRKGTGEILSGFNPAVNGEIMEILSTGDGQTAWVVGGFSSWNGQTIRRIIKINVNTGQRVTAFAPPNISARIDDISLRGGRLYIMGRFTTIAGQPHPLVAALNPNTGALIPAVKIDIAVPRPNRTGPLNVVSGDVTPDGSRMVIIGNFTEVEGQPRYQIAMLDLTTSPISLANWQTTEYDDPCSGSFDTYMRDVEISPDGTYFVVVTTGAFAGGQPSGTLCDTAARWDFSQTGTNLLPTWVNYTGGDTLLSTAVTESVVYLGGHQRWQNNPFCRDCDDGRGAVDREGIAAVLGLSGATVTWNPGRDRGVGVYGMKVTSEGLWVGSDTERIARWHLRPRLAFLPLAGGWALPLEHTGSLPGSVYSAGRDTGSTEQIHQVVRRQFDGSTVETSQTVPSSESGVAWGNLRGAFMVNGMLYYGWEEGGQRSLRVASFDGQTLGIPEVIDLRRLDRNRPTTMGMGLGTVRSPLNISNFQNFDLLATSMRGMFYDAESGRLYFTTPASLSPTANRLSWRQFSTESNIVGAVRNNGPANMPGISWQDVRSMFLAGSHLFIADTTGNLTRWDWQSNARTPHSGTPVPGSGVVVSGPNVDGEDWRARDAFLFVGENEVPLNQPPTASFTQTCEALTCTFSSTSTDPDGTIVSYLWDFGGGATSTEASPEHTFGVAGTYPVSLTVTDDDGANGSVTQDVTVEDETSPNEPPTASFTQTCEALTCTFSSTSTSTDPGGTIVSYLWNFGGGATSTQASPEYTFGAAGTYPVSLTVTDDDGASGSVTQDVMVEDETSPNVPPTASFTYSCQALTCSFSSTSTDSDGTIVSYLWDFGDGATSTQASPARTFGAAGTYPVSLTVTDDDGASGSATQDVTVTEPGQSTGVEFRAVNASNMNSAAPRVTVPASVQVGDVMVLFASMNSDSRAVTAPEGWISLGSLTSATATVQTHAWWKKATDADIGASVGPNVAAGAKTALQVLAYSNADAVSAAAVDIDTTLGTVRTTPTVEIANAGSLLLSYWADKSAQSSGWILPAGVTERSQTIGTGGGLMAAAAADSGPLPPGSAGGFTATSTAAENRRGIIWSVVITPVD